MQIDIDEEVLSEFEYLLRLHQQCGTVTELDPFGSVEELINYILATVATGSRRPGTWERERLLESMGLVAPCPEHQTYRAHYGAPPEGEAAVLRAMSEEWDEFEPGIGITEREIRVRVDSGATLIGRCAPSLVDYRWIAEVCDIHSPKWMPVIRARGDNQYKPFASITEAGDALCSQFKIVVIFEQEETAAEQWTPDDGVPPGMFPELDKASTKQEQKDGNDG